MRIKYSYPDLFKFHLVLICLLSQNIVMGQSADISKEKAFRLNGGISLRSLFYSATGIEARNPRTAFVATGNLSPEIYGIQLPISFSYSADGSASYSQPFNMFGISPRYKWVTLHAGYRQLNYQPYTLNGHTINGLGAELTPGKFFLSVMRGKLNRATTIDTISQDLVDASYTRKGIAGKIGYGDENKFVYLSFLRAIDDSTSLLIDKTKYNANLNPNLFAAQNVVGGLSFKYTFFKKLTLESDFALDVYTRDAQSPLAIEDPGNQKLLKLLNKVIYINGTSEYGTAGNAAIGYKGKDYAVKVKYQRIDPNFKSMGTYFIATDIENITVQPSFKLLKNKVRFNGSLGIQKDNLAKLKASTSKRWIGSANAGADITKKLGVDVNFSNYFINQRPGTTRFADTLRIFQSTYNLGITPRYIINTVDYTHLFLLSGQSSLLNDFNNSYQQGQQSRELKSLNSFFSYQLRFNQSGTSVGSTVNYTTLSNEFIKENNYGLTLNASKSLFQKKIFGSATASYLRNKRNGINGNIITGSLALQYSFLKSHSIGLNANYTNSEATDMTTGRPSFKEYRVELSYNYKL
ncbi:MAG: hypothetical protein ABI091_30810 [Ferruginibacter sp.]